MAPFTHRFLGLPPAQAEATRAFFTAISTIQINGPSYIAFSEWTRHIDPWPPRVGLHVLRTLLAFAWQKVVEEPEELEIRYDNTFGPIQDVEHNVDAFVRALDGLTAHPDLDPQEVSDLQQICQRLGGLPFARRWWTVSQISRLLVEWAIETGGTGIPDAYLDWPLRDRLEELKSPRKRLF